MEITLEKKDVTNATIKVNLKEEDYKPQVSKKLNEYSKKANLKGFRPGKVPTSLIEKMYGKSILLDEINALLSNSVSNYIKENKLPVIGDPLPDAENQGIIDWDTQKEFEFIYQVGLVPEFTYDLSNVKINQYKIEADDKVIEETTENLKNQYGKTVSQEISQEGDSIDGELKQIEGSLAPYAKIPLDKINKDDLPKFVGKAKGDKIVFNIATAIQDSATRAHVTGLSVEDAEKLEGEFELTIVNITRGEPASLDQEFFDKIFGKDNVKTEEEFKVKLKETIEENYQRESDHLFQNEIQDSLTGNTTIDLPNDFLKKWLLASNSGKVTQEQIDKEYEFYAKELKWNLIKNKISEDNGIKVENEEVLDKTKKMISQQFGGANFGEEMDDTLNKIADNYLKQEKGKNYLKLYEQVQMEKIMSTIKGKVNAEEKKVDVEEFKKIAGF